MVYGFDTPVINECM